MRPDKLELDHITSERRVGVPSVQYRCTRTLARVASSSVVGAQASRQDRRGTTRVLVEAMRRLQGLVMASILAQGCMHGAVSETGAGRPDLAVCELSDPCGGTGQADGIVSAVVAGAIVGTVMVALVRRFAGA